MTVDEVVRQLLGERRDGARSLALPPGFQGLPGMAHGGTVLALFDAAAGGAARRRIAAHYRKRVPLDAPLVLEVESGAGVGCRLLDPGGGVLVDGRVTPGSGGDAPCAGAPGPSGACAPERQPLPVSAQCFVCGIANDLGLQARLGFDERVVAGTWAARPPFRRADGFLAPAAVTALLDETAFWLGVLATGESGMTTELQVTLHVPAVDARSPLTVLGERASVTPREDPRYLDTSVVALDARSAVVATGRITFVAVRGAARRLADGMLAMNGADCLRRVFPAYVR